MYVRVSLGWRWLFGRCWVGVGVGGVRPLLVGSAFRISPSREQHSDAVLSLVDGVVGPVDLAVFGRSS